MVAPPAALATAVTSEALVSLSETRQLGANASDRQSPSFKSTAGGTTGMSVGPAAAGGMKLGQLSNQVCFPLERPR